MSVLFNRYVFREGVSHHSFEYLAETKAEAIQLHLTHFKDYESWFDAKRAGWFVESYE